MHSVSATVQESSFWDSQPFPFSGVTDNGGSALGCPQNHLGLLPPSDQACGSGEGAGSGVGAPEANAMQRRTILLK